ncbi:MAG TPA: lytic transglycosylase domain-containing protein [Gemmatimonadales bacterium]|nr:lytic transglycosylase domain-containing protein [Gemmatimonadales bacterium]
MPVNRAPLGSLAGLAALALIGDAAFDGLFWKAALESANGSGLEPFEFAALLKAHAQAESNFVTTAFRAESNNRASRGLMQILNTTATALGYTGSLGNDLTHTGGLYDPGVSIPLAAKLVRQNLVATKGVVNTAIAAYNEGLGRAQEDAAAGLAWRTFDPRYVQKVRANLTSYLPYFTGQIERTVACTCEKAQRLL